MKRALTLLLFSLSFFRLHAADGDSIWAANFIHDIYFTFSQASYWDSLINTHTTETYISGDMTFDGRSLPSVGVKMKGNSSFNNSSKKKSFKIDLNEFVAGQDYDGIKKFNLNNGFKDPTLMREKICLDFLNQHGIRAPRCTYARVYINNVYWGLYTIVEEVNSKFLKQQFPDNDGSLFKGDPTGDMKWYGSSASSYYSHYELQSDDTTYDWNNLVHLINLVNNTSAADYYDSLETVLDTWEFLYYMAATNMFVNLDSYIGSGHNYFIYADSTYNKFHWIAWDVNEAFGNFSMMMSVTQLENLAYDYVNQPANRPLATKMLADANYHAMYIDAFCNLMPDFSNAVLDPYIDSLANVIRTDVYADTMKFYTNQQFEDNMTMNVNQSAGLKPFITARHASLTSQLSAYGCWLSTAETATENSAASVFPNPSSTTATVQLPAGWHAEDCILHLVDPAGREVETGATTAGNAALVFSTEKLSDGVYFGSITDASGALVYFRFAVQH